MPKALLKTVGDKNGIGLVLNPEKVRRRLVNTFQRFHNFLFNPKFQDEFNFNFLMCTNRRFHQMHLEGIKLDGSIGYWTMRNLIQCQKFAPTAHSLTIDFSIMASSYLMAVSAAKSIARLEILNGIETTQ